jgi:O-antigen ligase
MPAQALHARRDLPDLARALAPVAVTLPFAALAAGLIVVADPLLALGAALALAVAGVVAARPLAGVLLGIVLIPAELYTLPVGGAAGVTASEAVFVVAGLSFVVRQVVSGRTPFVASPVTRPVLFLLATIVPGLFFADDPFAVLKTLVMWTSFAGVMWLVIADGRTRTVGLLLLALAVAGGVTGLIAAATGGPQQVVGYGSVVTGRAAGAFGSPNTLASFLALALPGALALSLRGGMSSRLVAAGSLAAIFAGLTLALSRGGLLAAFGALGLMLLWAPVRKVALVGVAVVLILTLNGSAAIDANEPVTRVTQRLATIGASADRGDPRFLLWPRLPEVIADHPVVGVGINQFPAMAERYGLRDPLLDAYFGHAHNVPLNFLVEQGVLGLLALLWLGAALVTVCGRAVRRGPPGDRGLAFAVSAALLAFALHGMVDVTLRTNVVAALVFLLAGCAVVLSRSRVPQERASASAR